MSLVTLDFESYYNPKTGYTLSKMTTEEYVRDPEFEVIMVGLKVDNGPEVWVPKNKIRSIFKRIDWGDTMLLCHHTQFDGFILSERYGIRPKFYLDTMSMARVKGNLKASLAYLLQRYETPTQKGHEVVKAAGKRFKDFSPTELASYGQYCCDDVRGTWELFQILKRQFPLNELKSIDQTVRMFTRPLMVIDPKPLEKHLVYLADRRTEVLNTVPGDTEESKLKKLRSNPQFAQLLRENGVENPPTKLNAKGKVTFAFAKTDPGLLNLLDNGTPEVQALVEARIGTKSSIEKTRCENYLSMSTRGPMPVYLSPSGALTTHRYAGGATEKDSGSQKQNLQNLNKFIKGTFEPHPLRMCLMAPEGFTMGVADSSQIEARIAVWFSGQTDVVEAFRQQRDVYSEQASVIYGRHVDRKNNPEDKVAGFVGKTCLAEGTLVLTNRGEVPIQDIELDDLVWDGVEWVSHEGLVYQGVQDVTSYAGLTATPDHEVYTHSRGKVSFGEASSRMERLVVTGVAGSPIRPMGNSIYKDNSEKAEYIRESQVPRVRKNPHGIVGEHNQGGIKRLFSLRPNRPCQIRQETTESFKTLPRDSKPLHKRFERGLRLLRRSWHRMSFHFMRGVCELRKRAFTAPYLLWCGDRPYRQRWPLPSGEFAPCYAVGKYCQPPQLYKNTVARRDNTFARVPFSPSLQSNTEVCKGLRHDRRTDYRKSVAVGAREKEKLAGHTRKAKVYDLVNAGPRHRFTANGYLVSNCVLGCGYGTGFVKAAGTFLQGALGAPPIQFDEQFADSLGISVHAFRANKWKLDRALEDPPATITRDEWLTQCAVSNYIVETFRANNSALVQMWKTCGSALDCVYEGIEFTFGVDGLVKVIPHVGLQLPEGVIIYYRDLKKDEEGYTYLGKKDGRVQRVRIFSSKVFENICQCLAGMIVRRQMLQIGKRYPVLFQVHDEIPALLPERNAQEGLDYMLKVMHTAPPWARGLPLAAEGSFGKRYGEAK